MLLLDVTWSGSIGNYIPIGTYTLGEFNGKFTLHMLVLLSETFSIFTLKRNPLEEKEINPSEKKNMWSLSSFEFKKIRRILGR